MFSRNLGVDSLNKLIKICVPAFFFIFENGFVPTIISKNRANYQRLIHRIILRICSFLMIFEKSPCFKKYKNSPQLAFTYYRC